jgi:molybdopterin-containing oxidoreductase family iron-sulfur binding subunit
MTEKAPETASASGGDSEARAENDRKWQLSRRKLLQLMGAAGAAGVIAPIALNLPSREPARPAEADATPPQRLRRWGMVIDLRKCDGCQSQGTPPQCTTACIEGHYAPSPMEWIEVFEQELAGGGTQFIPVPCQSCQNPPCINVCPVGATWSTPEGPVLIDQIRCIGCRMCMAACPYDRRFFNWGDPPIPPQAKLADYHPERQVPMRRGVTAKCDFCPDMARAGRLPFCAQGCPTNAIYYGDFEENLATNGVEVVELTTFLTDNQAFRLREELGTKPRVYYIPGYGQDVGRDPHTEGRLPARWPWEEKAKGAKEWKRSSR